MGEDLASLRNGKKLISTREYSLKEKFLKYQVGEVNRAQVLKGLSSYLKICLSYSKGNGESLEF